MSGLIGWKKLFGVQEYFNGIPEALEADGAQVYVVTANQGGAIPDRATEIVPQLHNILAETGAEKLNLIGHSFGGLDARYIAATEPGIVASVTAISSPNRGTEVADTVVSKQYGDLDNAGLQAIEDFIKLASGSPYPNDADAAVEQLSLAGMAAFNARYPAALPADCGEGEPVVDGVAYYSWGGTAIQTNAADVSDPVFLALSAPLQGPSDGLVPRCSSHLGKVIRDDYTLNHGDEVNLLFGLVSLNSASPISLYRQQANRLKLAGL